MHRRRVVTLLATGLASPAVGASGVPEARRLPDSRRLPASVAAPPLDPDSVARLIAGVPPASDHPLADRLVATADWIAHRDWVRPRWAEVERRLDAMRRWADSELRLPDAHRRTLLYPFSGPDFSNADALFPMHPRLVMFGLERPGRLPEIERLDAAQFARLLGDVRYALSDLIERNHFVTDYMTRQLTSPFLKGTLPVITASMVLSGHRIVSIEPLDPFPELTREYAAADPRSGAFRPPILLRGARVSFAEADGRIRTLEYYSLDATDRALRWYPGFLDLLSASRPASVLLKSASYLLHDGQFASTRERLMQTADIVVQDDTGIPFRRLQESGWAVRLYGVYTPPLRSLRYAAQPDLEAAYRAAPTAPTLGFPFGYHGRDGRSAMQVARRGP